MKILLIDDDIALRASVARMFSMRGYEVLEAMNGDEAAAAATTAIGAVISDYDFSMADGRNGVDICTEIRPLCDPDTRFIIYSGLDRAVPEWATFSSKMDLLGLIDLVGPAE